MRTWAGDERGNIAALLAILIVPIAGAMALVTETGTWYLHQRAEQRAADAAVMAASIASMAGNTASSEAAAVATSYGYTDDGGDIRVQTFTTCPTGIAAAVSCNASNCPTGTSPISGSGNCVWVYIKRKIPIYLTRIVGYQGDTTLASGIPARTTYAIAAAGVVPGAQHYCFGAKTGFTADGLHNIDWGGCSLTSGGDAACNGASSSNGMLFGDAAGQNGKGSKSNNGCGTVGQRSGIPFQDTIGPQVTSALSSLDSNCSSWSTASSFTTLGSGYNCFSPTSEILSPGAPKVTVSNPNTVLVIKNGTLKLNTSSITTTGSGSLTIVITGNASVSSPMIDFSSGGSLDIAAPGPVAAPATASPWQGVAVAIDPSLTSSGGKKGTNLDFNFTGNSHQLNITGGIYDINGAFNVHGDVSSASSSGYNCIGIWANSITVAGTGNFLTNATDCNAAGLDTPTAPIVALLQ